MIELREVNSESIVNVHRIFPGNEGKYWVNFNWYWAELSMWEPRVLAKFIHFARHNSPSGFVAYGQHFKDRQLKIAVSGAYELYHMVIDAREQGRGLGRASTIHILQEMATVKNCEQLVVACNPNNKAATELYLSLGFKETDRNYDDDPLYTITPKAVSSLNLCSIRPGGTQQQDRSSSEKWERESIQSEKEFSWAAWEQGLET